jgi:putative CocE/NonD family hydrolase
MARPFFDYYLLVQANSWETTSKITYYEMGSNIWKYSDNADISAAGSNLLYLSDYHGLDGQPGSYSSTFSCDPKNPSPTMGGATLSQGLDQGPYDQSSLESRSDVLYFNSQVFEEAITVTGRINLELYVSTTQADGDIAVRLLDEYPDGRSILITDGIKRIRFRNGNYFKSDEDFVSPGEIVVVPVNLPFTSYSFQPGHRMNIYISGNHASRFDVNLQNGGEMYVAGDTNVANITIHHNPNFKSRITIPGNNAALAIEDRTADQVLFFPNPANDFINIPSSIAATKIQIISLSGQIQVEQKSTITQQMNTSRLAEGSYILKVTTPDGSTSNQLISIRH